jgi:MFS family permease
MGALIGSPVVGALIDKYSVRRVTIASTAGLAVGLACLGLFTNSLIQFYAFGMLAGTVGAGTTSVTWSRAVIAWFQEKRGFALGLALTGSGLCAALAPIYATWLLESYGWRAAYVGLALLPALLGLPVAFLFLRMPAVTVAAAGVVPVEHSGLTLRQAVRGYSFWGIGLGLFLAGFGTSGIVPHLIPLLTDRGLTPMDAARIAGSLGLAVMTGRVVAGFLIDRLWAPGVAAVALGLPAVASIVLAGEQSSTLVTTLAAMTVGFAGGAEFDLLAFLTAKYLGLKRYGVIYGCMYALFVTASGIAPVVFGMVFDAQGTYVTVLYIGAACFIGSSAMMLTLGRYPRLDP